MRQKSITYFNNTFSSISSDISAYNFLWKVDFVDSQKKEEFNFNLNNALDYILNKKFTLRSVYNIKKKTNLFSLDFIHHKFNNQVCFDDSFNSYR